MIHIWERFEDHELGGYRVETGCNGYYDDKSCRSLQVGNIVKLYYNDEDTNAYPIFETVYEEKIKNYHDAQQAFYDIVCKNIEVIDLFRALNDEEFN